MCVCKFGSLLLTLPRPAPLPFVSDVLYGCPPFESTANLRRQLQLTSFEGGEEKFVSTVEWILNSLTETSERFHYGGLFVISQARRVSLSLPPHPLPHLTT